MLLLHMMGTSSQLIGLGTLVSALLTVRTMESAQSLTWRQIHVCNRKTVT